MALSDNVDAAAKYATLMESKENQHDPGTKFHVHQVAHNLEKDIMVIGNLEVRFKSYDHKSSALANARDMLAEGWFLFSMTPNCLHLGFQRQRSDNNE